MKLPILMAFAVAFVTIVVLGTVVVEQKHVIDAQRVYMQAGCNGRYQGAE